MSASRELNLAWPFWCHAQSHPQRPALVVEEQSLTYSALADAAARVAAWLGERIARGVGAAPLRVGILAARSVQAYAGILGAAWAGGAYVPLSPRQPAARLANIIQQAGINALIVDRRGAARLTELANGAPPHVLLADPCEVPQSTATSWSALADLHALPTPAAVTADDLAYILFTSGTTGQPKGVMISIGALSSFLGCIASLYRLDADDRVAQFIELTFDPSVMELFGCWNAGASLHVVPETKLMAPGGFLRDHAITFLSSVPSLVTVMGRMKQLSPGALPALRISIFGGEGLPVELTRLWRIAAPNSIIDNQYGPTEATVCCLVQRIGDAPIETSGRGTLAIGKPLPGMEAAIVAPDMSFLAPGEVGELAVAGPQLATGYVGDAGQTARRFPTLDHPRLGGSRWYLTGDLASCDHDGNFHCLGRIDNQVKVMGHRVELEEVEAHLRAAAGSESVAAVAWPSNNGNAAGLIAFVSGARHAPADIRDRMRLRVPAYMLPSKVLTLESLPLSTHGKVDRHVLRKLLDDGATATGASATVPVTAPAVSTR